MSDEINGWGTFSTTTSTITLDVIDFQPFEVVLDDDIDTTTNSNGDATGGVKSKEPGWGKGYGDTTFTVPLDYDVKSQIISAQGVKDTGTLTSASGAVESGTGWFRGCTPDTNSPSDRPTMSVVWANYTGKDGETPPTITPAV
jgi:hypothetical protein